MAMNKELEALREEITKLRERVAVLEARPARPPLQLFKYQSPQSPPPQWVVPQDWPPYPVVTC
jgi:hypothetical protein